MWEHDHAAFGLRLGASTRLPLRPDDGAARPALTLHPLPARELAARWSGRARLLWQADRDDVAVSVERGHAGDHRIRAEGVATFLLTADGTRLLCADEQGGRPAPGDAAGEQGWVRMLSELALPCASLLLGNEALHAGAVALDGGTVALLAPSGGGKSTLVAALLETGGTLVSDDVLVLRRDGERIVAEPGAPSLKLADPRAPGRERRVELSCGDLAARPLTLLVVLARGALGTRLGATRIERLQASPVPVLAHALSLPSTPARASARLALYRDLLADTPVVRLAVDARETPARMAELVVAASMHEAVPA